MPFTAPSYGVIYSAFVPTAGGVVSMRKGGIDPFKERVVEMAQCEVCGNEYDKAFRALPTNVSSVSLSPNSGGPKR